MDSPVRQYLKQKDYQRHKLFRKMKRRKKAEQLLAIDAPIKELRRRLKRFGDGKDKLISDQEYYSIMEKVAEKNNEEWNRLRIEEGGTPLSKDEEYLRILNDNAYDYRGYYNKYPNGDGNALDHWTDEFKTVYHPTFSTLSKYSGKKSQYNPKGILGGHWNGEEYIPAWGQLLPSNVKPRGWFEYNGGKDKYYYQTTDKESGLQYNIHPSAFDAKELEVTLPETQITAPRKLEYRSAFKGNLEYLGDMVSLTPVIGDAYDAYNAAQEARNGNYLNAGMLAGGIFLPNILEKPAKWAARYINNSKLRQKLINSTKGFDLSDHFDNDASIRYALAKLERPRINFVYHGRRTNRGNPNDALRTYSDRDVGLHLTENKPTAKRFSKDDGVVYQGIDYGQYPDAIYPDLGVWDAESWYYALDKARELTPELEKQALLVFDPSVIDRQYGIYKAIRDITKHYNIDFSDILKYKRTLLFPNKETANKEFAKFLAERGVKFKYKNDYEGGGYMLPSIFIADKSDIHWIPEIQMAEKRKTIMPTLDFKSGRILPGTTSFPEYYEKSKLYNCGKNRKTK